MNTTLKIKKNMLALILTTITLLLLLLTGCAPVSPQPSGTDTAPGSDNNGAATDSPTEPQPELPAEPISVIKDQKTEYSVVLGEGVSDGNRDDLDWLYRIMDEKYGIHPGENMPGTKKITVKLYGDQPMDWSVKIDRDSGEIALLGGSAPALRKAIYYFATQFCGSSDNELTVKVDGGYTYDYSEMKINNSSFLSYEGGVGASHSASNEKGDLLSPDWLKSAVMVEVRIDTASLGGSIPKSTRLIDFYADAGVNVIWLTPIYQKNGGNGYGNGGLHTVEPTLSGTYNHEKGWQEVKKLVDYAHSKGVYVILDIITWGAVKKSALYDDHPDWFNGQAWGSPAFHWANETFREWFISQAVKNIEITGADGYRCDCEPFTAGYEVFAEIRKRLNEKNIYPLIMSEDGSYRSNAFDCEQDGVLDTSLERGIFYAFPSNPLVDGMALLSKMIKTGEDLLATRFDRPADSNVDYGGMHRFYVNCISNHDHESRNVCGNRLKIGYSAIYAPFIPLWYMGDEFGVESQNKTLYFTDVKWSELEDSANALFFEDVKQMISIRRSYPDIFEYWPLNHREINYQVVKVDGITDDKIESFARAMGNRMVIVVPNNDRTCNKETQSGAVTVHTPLTECFSENYDKYRITDLLTGRVIVEGQADTVETFSAVIPYQYMGVYLVEGIMTRQ